MYDGTMGGGGGGGLNATVRPFGVARQPLTARSNSPKHSHRVRVAAKVIEDNEGFPKTT